MGISSGRDESGHLGDGAGGTRVRCVAEPSTVSTSTELPNASDKEQFCSRSFEIACFERDLVLAARRWRSRVEDRRGSAQRLSQRDPASPRPVGVPDARPVRVTHPFGRGRSRRFAAGRVGEDSQSGTPPSSLTATTAHYFSRGVGASSGYFARSARHFFASSGLFVAV